MVLKENGMKKIYLSAGIVLTTVMMAMGQQKAQFTQYMINPFLYNPAVSGTEGYTDIRAGYRKQWVGFEGSPRSVYLSAHTNIGRSRVVNDRIRNKKNGFHGIGAVITNDEIGATSTTTLGVAYSYHVKLSKTWFASLGAMTGLQQYSLESSKLTTASGGDAAINGFSSRSLADINIGGWVYSDKFFAGATMIQVVPQRLYNMATNAIEKGRSVHHYMVIAGYRVPLGNDFTWIPSVCLKAVSPAPVSFDFNSKIRYKNLGWIGVSYRHKDAVAAMIGIIINDTFDFSYSYDYTTSRIRQFSGGSHEVVVGYRLRTKQQVLCPSNFW